MRKLFTITISFFLILSACLIIFFDKNTSDFLSVVTIKQNYQRLITEDEELSITVYISSNDSFVSDTSNIDSLYIMDEYNEMELGISDIRSLDYSESYQNTKYFAYVIDLNFNIINIDNYLLELVNANLEINYLNGEKVTLEIGNLSLNFRSYENPTYIDVYRMFAMYQVVDFEYVSGIVLGITNKTGMDISISNIDISNSNVTLDLDNAVFLSSIPSYQADINDILGYSYNSIGTSDNQTSLELIQDSLIFIPFKYNDEIIRINRFPLIIEFSYNQLNNLYYIDDFQFNSQTLGLEESSGRIREFIYNYQGSN